jgi:hypothetical protein
LSVYSIISDGNLELSFFLLAEGFLARAEGAEKIPKKKEKQKFIVVFLKKYFKKIFVKAAEGFSSTDYHRN